MDIVIGKWINEGGTPLAAANAPSVKITTSDVYEWATGGFFVLLAAYGRESGLDGGGKSLLKDVRDRAAGCGLVPGPTWQIPALRQPCRGSGR